jgi:hypothetical protein
MRRKRASVRFNYGSVLYILLETHIANIYLISDMSIPYLLSDESHLCRLEYNRHSGFQRTPPGEFQLLQNYKPPGS